IDLQQQVLETAWQRDDVVARTAGLIARARAQQTPIVFIQHHAKDGGGLVRGTEGWKFVAEVAPGADDTLVEKNYSDAFVDTDLGAILDGLGASHLVVAGAQSDACITTTVRRALAEGYDVTLAEDCHTTSNRSFDDSRVEGDIHIDAVQVVAHLNLCVWSLTYPGQVSTVAPAAEIDFTLPEQVAS
ncbi:MAG: cysteine hydrolase, partial [Nocardioidaceae bacterium]|nr:cysteine hydrolase [Nocardioidaceae bacterium]